MKITIIHGQNHKGSTYNIAHELAEKLNGEITEFFLPKDFGEFCLGCGTCFTTSEKKCPHYEKTQPLTAAIDAADVLIFDSPVYVYHVTGSMKAFLDHYGYRWMVHSPEESMFKKQAVCITTAAGAGLSSTLKDLKDSLYFWGVAKIYKYGIAVASLNWDGGPDKKLKSIDKATTKLAKKISRRNGKVKPGLKTKAFFFLMHLLQRNGITEKDRLYWKEKGWIGNKRPWK